MSSSASGRPPELDDAEWLARRYAQSGDMTIALELHVDRKTVRHARERLGIPSQPPGRRRGASSSSSAPTYAGAPVVAVASPSVLAIAARFVEESRPSGPAPSEMLLASRIRALSDAGSIGDEVAYDEALVEVATAAALIHDRRRRLREH